MKKYGLVEFTRILKGLLDPEEDCKVVFFLGAGCSISSGVPGAGKLVSTNWLPKLKKQKTSTESGADEWAKDLFGDYDKDNPGASYNKVIKELFPTTKQRQIEIERVTGRRDPGFGYAVLAKLMAHEKYGQNCYAALTTNFDDMVADALYLYTSKKPLVVTHDSLVDFVSLTRTTRQQVFKLHGDAFLEPKNSPEETAELPEKVVRKLNELLSEAAIVFIGYSGNDGSITKYFAEQLRPGALPFGVYWVHENIPETEFGEWLKSGKSGPEGKEFDVDIFHVDHLDFDELMLMVRKEFELEHPEKKRFDDLMKSYRDTFEKLTKKIDEEEKKEEKDEDSEALKAAADEAVKDFENWWSVALEAEKYFKSDPDRADGIYREGLKKFPESAPLLGNYALFLEKQRKDYDGAEEYYKRALQADPEYAIHLGNYANFLWKQRKDNNGAGEYYKRALQADPEDAGNLGNYSLFLEKQRKDYDGAEEYYKRALQADPEHLIHLGNYAVFLEKQRKDYDGAEEYYKRALKSDPEDANTLGNYAGFLTAMERMEEGFMHLEKAIKLAEADEDTLKAECRFYQYAHGRNDKEKAEGLKELRSLLKAGARSKGWDLSRNIARAREDGHPAPEFLEALAKVIAEEEDISTLEIFKEWVE